MTPATLPLPPTGLAIRVGTVQGAEALRFYLQEGARLREVIGGLLPPDWSWSGKRVLDFGCGSARVLRHFADEAQSGDFHGCDIDAASIDWDRAHLSPPFQFFRNEPAPPLPVAASSLDLIWAMSVFTHIADLWSDWLAELHRLLAPGGILIASFLGDGMWEPLVGEPYREDLVGMTVLRSWEGPEAEVFHSEWWLREHWGRAFDVLDVSPPPRESDGTPRVTHSYIALRRREVELGRADLERIDPDERREVAGLQTNLRLTRSELVALAARARDSPFEALHRAWSSLNRRARHRWAMRRPTG
jgi:SAM-dependent methyltransferase